MYVHGYKGIFIQTHRVEYHNIQKNLFHVGNHILFSIDLIFTVLTSGEDRQGSTE